VFGCDCALRAAAILRAVGLLAMLAIAPARAAVRLDLPIPDRELPLTISAHSASHWVQGQYDVWVLHGKCRIEQGHSRAESEDAVLWVLHEDSGGGRLVRVIAYLEGDVRAKLVEDQRTAQVREQNWLAEFETVGSFRIKSDQTEQDPRPRPEIYQRGMARRDPHQPGISPTQRWTQPGISPLPALPRLAPPPQTIMPTPVVTAPPAGTRRLLANPRSTVPPQIKWFSNPAQTEWIATIDSGINLVIEGVGNLGVVDISADRAVLWTQAIEQPDIGGGALQASDQPLEIYLEGNVVFREGQRIVYAERMYYNVRTESGIVLSAEFRMPAPGYGGLLRLKSDLVEITGRDRFLAYRSYVTSSGLGAPRYRVQAGTLSLVDSQYPAIDPATGAAAVDPVTGEPAVEHRQFLTSTNNVVFLGPAPVFYWPYFASDVTDPTFLLRRVQLRNDQIFGTQVLTTLNAFQIFGIRNKPIGTDWTLHADYLSKRGIGLGTTFLYNTPRFLGTDSPGSGLFDAWGIHDRGIDNLGSDRRDVPLGTPDRGRVLARHRQLLPNNFMLSGELGLVSDRNFLESFYEREWDEFKDQSTDLELRRLVDGTSWWIRAQARPNPYFTETQWLPRADHYWLGQSLLGDRLTWFEHSSAGYAQYQIAAFPDNPVDAAKFVWMPWEQQRSGERLLTRQELDLPFDLGPFRIVPYGLGEAGRWGQGLDGNPINRLYGQAGVRSSLPFWSANPLVESPLLNVHGLAHKVSLEADFAVSATNHDVTQFPLYDPLDDNNIEQFRRRFTFNTFGGPVLPTIVPAPFDPRFYALRTGIQDWVTATSPEVVSDFMTLRLGALQRLQTKRGMPGQRRITDWMVLYTGVTYFPDPNRDNFGAPFGLLNYNYQWHVGDRTSIVSDGVFDFFNMGQKIWTVGAFLTRPPRASLYLGFRWLEGPELANVLTPFRSKVLIASYTYQLSPKWFSTLGTAVDVGGNGNIGQTVALTRIGESFLMSAGFNVDASKGNVGATFLVEPRFLPRGQLRGYIPPANTVGLQ
jgi:hypothetical protein